MICVQVDLDDPDDVAAKVHHWISEDLALGACGRCAELTAGAKL